LKLTFLIKNKRYLLNRPGHRNRTGWGFSRFLNILWFFGEPICQGSVNRVRLAGLVWLLKHWT